MRLATWNLNHRVGKTTFRLEAAHAAVALDADVLVLTEFYPKEQERAFRAVLENGGWTNLLISAQTGEVANKVLVASRVEMEPLDLQMPNFDEQFPSNILALRLPSIGLSVVAVRVPWYEKKEAPLVSKAWDWLEHTAALLAGSPAILLGDLNVSVNSTASRGGEHFRRILSGGWHRAQPTSEASFLGHGTARSEIDHILGTRACRFTNADCVLNSAGFAYAGSNDALSDHAALICELHVS